MTTADMTQVIGYLAMSTKATEDEIPRLFEMLRDGALTNN